MLYEWTYSALHRRNHNIGVFLGMELQIYTDILVSVVCIVVCLVSPSISAVPLGYRDSPRLFGECLSVCGNPRDVSCLLTCLTRGSSLEHGTDIVQRVRRDVGGQKCMGIKCAPGSYCDVNIGRNGACSTCNNVCDHHEYQGTTEECNNLCPGYLKESVTVETIPTTDASQENRGKDGEVPPEKDDLGKKVKDNGEDKGEGTLNNVWSMTAAIVAIAVIIALVVVIAVVIEAQKTISGWLHCKERVEERKSPLPCSQEGDAALCNSTAPLMQVRQSGPIAQERPMAHQESGAQSEYQGDLVQGQSEYQGDLVQGQSEYQGDLVQGQSEYQGDLVQGQSEYQGDLVQDLGLAGVPAWRDLPTIAYRTKDGPTTIPKTTY